MNELINAVSKYYDSIVAILGAIVLVSELLTRYTKAAGFLAWLQSWGISIVISLFGAYFNIGIFVDQGQWSWLPEGIFSGIILGLAANGFFSVPGVTKALEMIKVREKPKSSTALAS